MNYYSAKTNGFYSLENKEAFDLLGEWPDDALALSGKEYNQLMSGQASGMIIVADESGIPILIEPKPSEVTIEELIAVSNVKKTELLAMATTKIAPLQDAVDMDIATEEEKSNLQKWKKYRVLVSRVNTENAPDIAWPEEPENVA